MDMRILQDKLHLQGIHSKHLSILSSVNTKNYHRSFYDSHLHARSPTFPMFLVKHYQMHSTKIALPIVAIHNSLFCPLSSYFSSMNCETFLIISISTHIVLNIDFIGSLHVRVIVCGFMRMCFSIIDASRPRHSSQFDEVNNSILLLFVL